jgi:dihydrofolate reductase
MRKVVAIDWVSADGYFATADGKLDWVKMDPAVEVARHEMGRSVESLLFGGNTYRMFASTWPQKAADPKADDREKNLAKILTEADKIVVSRTIQPSDLTWENSRLLSGELIAGVASLRRSNGGDIGIFGSGQVVRQLVKSGLMDEFILCVSPIALGAGMSLFGGGERVELALLETRKFDSGNLILRYQARSGSD